MIRFDWHRSKAQENLRKHGISFDEACTIFVDRSILSRYGERHSSGEDRWISMAISALGRILVVIHTGPDVEDAGDELIRIISARRANKKEQRVYLERQS